MKRQANTRTKMFVVRFRGGGAMRKFKFRSDAGATSETLDSRPPEGTLVPATRKGRNPQCLEEGTSGKGSKRG